MGAGFANRALGGGDASAVDQAAEFAQALRFGNHRCRLLFIGNIAMHEHATEFGGDGLAFFVLHISDDDFAASLAQQFCRAFAQTGRAAGHDKYIALDLHEKPFNTV